MELNNALTTLFNAAPHEAQQSKEAIKVESATQTRSEEQGFRNVSYFGASSQASHLDRLSQRIDMMTAALSRLMQSSPGLSEAPTVLVERGGGEITEFAYSLTRDETGGYVEEFSFKVSYRPANGEAAPRQTSSEVPSPPAESIKPEATSSAQPATSALDGAEISGGTEDLVAADPTALDGEIQQTPEQRVAELIEYYRIKRYLPADSQAPETIETEDLGESKPVAFGGDRNGDIHSIFAENASRIYTGDRDDLIEINAVDARRIEAGDGDDRIEIDAEEVSRIRGGGGDDIVNIVSDSAHRITTGEGDDALSIRSDEVSRINTGDGDDILELYANSIERVDAGAGDDTLTIDANDAAINFSKGGGQDVINIKSVGALAIRIDGALATSSEDFSIVHDGDSVVLEFHSGEKLTLNGVSGADMIAVKVGGETIDLHLSEPPVEMDMSA